MQLKMKKLIYRDRLEWNLWWLINCENSKRRAKTEKNMNCNSWHNDPALHAIWMYHDNWQSIVQTSIQQLSSSISTFNTGFNCTLMHIFIYFQINMVITAYYVQKNIETDWNKLEAVNTPLSCYFSQCFNLIAMVKPATTMATNYFWAWFF